VSDFNIVQQTEAEKDQYLIGCFYDAGFIQQLKESQFYIIGGRKGSGKTAIARYLEKKYEDHGIDYAFRLSVRNINMDGEKEDNLNKINSILYFILVKTILKLLEKEIFDNRAEKYWRDFLLSNGLQQVSDYETFIESEKENKTGFSLKAWATAVWASAEASTELENNSKLNRVAVSKSPSAIFEALRQSLPCGKSIFIFIDDIGDHLETIEANEITKDIKIIQEVLLRIETYNTALGDDNKNLRFISLLREDLFDLMDGSNINKLREGTLQLKWNERSFAGLLIRRLPFYRSNLEESLADPINAIKKQFPDDIFNEALSNFDMKRFQTNFYAYMVSISFNRPRDFLKFCYAMRDRLSLKHTATFENIESAEMEYSDYFKKELRDELFVTTRILGHELDDEKLDELIDILNKKEGFNSAEIRTRLGNYLVEKTSLGKKKIEFFISELYRYSVLGFKEKDEQIINFKYTSSAPLILDKIKKYLYFLHRGLWWFARKRIQRTAKGLDSHKSANEESKSMESIDV
jgi:hypothetical protein